MRYLAGVTSMTLTITLLVLPPSTPTLSRGGGSEPKPPEPPDPGTDPEPPDPGTDPDTPEDLKRKPKPGGSVPEKTPP